MSQVIEINGLRVEVSAVTTAEYSFKIGDAAKILVVPSYAGSEPAVHPAVIVNFENFQDLPTLVVAYLTNDYNAELKFAHVNAKSAARYQLVPADNLTLALDKQYVVQRMDNEITRKERELADLIARKDYFLSRFGKFFTAQLERELNAPA